jgi:SAM-dependent methyltransferase
MIDNPLPLTNAPALPRAKTSAFPRPGERFRHPAVLILLLGGAVGSALNLGITLYFHRTWGTSPYAAFFVGTFVNLLFHHLYYALVFAQQEDRLRPALPIQLLLYGLVASGSLGLLWFFLSAIGIDLLSAVLASLVCQALLSLTLVRISTFGSAKLAEIEYQDVGETFYDDQTDRAKVGWFRAWFHSSRFDRLTKFVDQWYRPGMSIADLGCGNCLWNTKHLPVTGVDINEKMMGWAKANGHLQDFRKCANLGQTGLPEKSFDIVVMSETLEHLLNLPEVLGEVRRILKDDGTFLITVPYDIFMGPFFVLFNINCVYQGYFKGSHYHKYRCGHVNHFSISRLKSLLSAHGFKVPKVSIVNGLNIYAAAKKTA